MILNYVSFSNSRHEVYNPNNYSYSRQENLYSITIYRLGEKQHLLEILQNFQL